MKERPILFSGPMVRAILDGRRTQTRRVFKVAGQPITSPDEEIIQLDGTFHYRSTGGLSGPYPCPYGEPGDRLWVRETFCHIAGDTIYRADWTDRDIAASDAMRKAFPSIAAAYPASRWKPSIHMPRKFCRLILDVKLVRVERLHEISDKDVLSEGISESEIEKWRKWLHPNDAPGKAFGELWDTLNEKRGYGWGTNPWVWVIEFQSVEDSK